MKRRRAVSHAVVRRLALALPEVVEASHLGRPDFRVRGKIFATLPVDKSKVVLKSTAADVSALVSADGATFWDEWRGRWLGVQLDGVSMPFLRDLIADAWRVVAPKRIAVTLRSTPS
jgi:hypothetical protein